MVDAPSCVAPTLALEVPRAGALGPAAMRRSRQLLPTAAAPFTRRPGPAPRRGLAPRLSAAEEPLEAFAAWLTEHEVARDKVQPAQIPGWGTGLVAGPSGVKKGDRLLSIPTELHMTPAAVASSPVGEAVAEVAAGCWRLRFASEGWRGNFEELRSAHFLRTVTR